MRLHSTQPLVARAHKLWLTQIPTIVFGSVRTTQAITKATEPPPSGAWLRDAHPHEALILTPCGHAYSEIFWKAKLSTRIDQSARTGSWAAQRSRCCAPVPGGGTCGALLRQAGGFRMTHCNPPRSAGLHPSGGWAPLAELMRSLPVHGAIGARVEAAVRLLLALRLHAAREGLPPSEAKVVIFSRFDATLTLLTRACALNGLSCLTLSAQCGSLAAGGAVATQEAAKFCADASIQVSPRPVRHLNPLPRPPRVPLFPRPPSHANCHTLHPALAPLGSSLLAPLPTSPFPLVPPSCSLRPSSCPPDAAPPGSPSPPRGTCSSWNRNRNSPPSYR